MVRALTEEIDRLCGEIVELRLRRDRVSRERLRCLRMRRRELCRLRWMTVPGDFREYWVGVANRRLRIWQKVHGV